MEGSIDYHPSKLLKIAHKQNHYSTFECLPGELILKLFEYFNTKEILQSFFNLTAFINACIFDRRQQLHLYLDHQMPFFSENYAPDQIISLYIEQLIIPIRIFSNLKSLYIVYDDEEKIAWLDMVKQIFELSQLVSFTLSLFGTHLTETHHEMIKAFFCHPSLRRIILFKSHEQSLYPLYIRSSVKLVSRLAKLVYMSNGIHGKNYGHLQCKLGSDGIGKLEPLYNIRSLDLDFNNWRAFMLAELLSSLPSLVELKIKGLSQSVTWYYPFIWERMLKNLKALQRVSINIDNFYPAGNPQNRLRRFKDAVEQKYNVCKRINLTLEKNAKRPGRSWFQISASLGMD